MTRLRYPEGLILSVAKVAEVNAREQVAEFSAFGINETFLNQFKEKIQQAEALPGTLAKRIELIDQTVKKDRVLDEAYAWGQALRMRVDHGLPGFKW